MKLPARESKLIIDESAWISHHSKLVYTPILSNLILREARKKVALIEVHFSGTLIVLSADVLAGSSLTFQRTQWTLKRNLGWYEAPKRCRFLWRFQLFGPFGQASRDDFYRSGSVCLKGWVKVVIVDRGL